MRSTSATVRAWHRKIGERLEAGYAPREEEVAAELAVHFDRGQMPARAARYYLAAGDRTGLHYGLYESVAHYERVRALIEACRRVESATCSGCAPRSVSVGGCTSATD